MPIINCTGKDITMVDKDNNPLITYHKTMIEIPSKKVKELIVSECVGGSLDGIPLAAATVNPNGPDHRNDYFYLVDPIILSTYERGDFIMASADRKSFIRIV